MSSLSLLLWIVGAVLLQLASYLGYRFWRHWLDYLALRRSAIPASDEVEVGAPAWQGLRWICQTNRRATPTASHSTRKTCVKP